MCSQIRPTWVTGSLHQLVSHHPTFVIHVEGVVLIDSRISGEKLEKWTISAYPCATATTCRNFTFLQTVTEQLKNIVWFKFVHSEDITIKGNRVFWHIRHIEFEPSGSAVVPNPVYFKMTLSVREDGDSHCTPVVQSLLDNFLLGIFLYFHVTPKVQNLADVSN